MDLKSREMFVEYSKAKDEMFAYTDTKINPWYAVDADDKKCARLNCIHHLLSLIPHQDLTPEPFELPQKKENKGYVRPPMEEMTYIPAVY